ESIHFDFPVDRWSRLFRRNDWLYRLGRTAYRTNAGRRRPAILFTNVGNRRGAAALGRLDRHPDISTGGYFSHRDHYRAGRRAIFLLADFIEYKGVLVMLDVQNVNFAYHSQAI